VLVDLGVERLRDGKRRAETGEVGNLRALLKIKTDRRAGGQQDPPIVEPVARGQKRTDEVRSLLGAGLSRVNRGVGLLCELADRLSIDVSGADARYEDTEDDPHLLSW
jgi:hypothetical protein